MDLPAARCPPSHPRSAKTRRCTMCRRQRCTASPLWALPARRWPALRERLAAHSDAALESVVRDGMPGTAMPGNRELDASQLRGVVAYLRTLPLRNGMNAPSSATSGRASDAVASSREVLSLLEQALVAARAG